MKRTKNSWDTENTGTLEVFFKGLADVSRLRILSLLLHGELCGCDIQYVLDASQSNVSETFDLPEELRRWCSTVAPDIGFTTASPLNFLPITSCFSIIWNELFGGRGCLLKI